MLIKGAADGIVMTTFGPRIYSGSELRDWVVNIYCGTIVKIAIKSPRPGRFYIYIMLERWYKTVVMSRGIEILWGPTGSGKIRFWRTAHKKLPIHLISNQHRRRDNGSLYNSIKVIYGCDYANQFCVNNHMERDIDGIPNYKTPSYFVVAISNPFARGQNKQYIPTILHTFDLSCLGFNMMTSSNGNIFPVTGPFCGEFTGHRWIPRIKASNAKLWCFLWSAPE